MSQANHTLHHNACNLQAESLDRARNGQSMANYAAIFHGFAAKGITETDIRPRENVFTFNAWKALGRSVKKGEHGVKVVTFIDRTMTERDSSSGEEIETSYRQPHNTTVFHISQTEPTAERQARAPASGRAYRGWRREGNRQVPDHRADYVCDPGELAADRWNETHY